jgi:hypothetical protein
MPRNARMGERAATPAQDRSESASRDKACQRDGPEPWHEDAHEAGGDTKDGDSSPHWPEATASNLDLHGQHHLSQQSTAPRCTPDSFSLLAGQRFRSIGHPPRPLHLCLPPPLHEAIGRRAAPGRARDADRLRREPAAHDRAGPARTPRRPSRGRPISLCRYSARTAWPGTSTSKTAAIGVPQPARVPVCEARCSCVVMKSTPAMTTEGTTAPRP